jgi:hypothetical protein
MEFLEAELGSGINFEAENLRSEVSGEQSDGSFTWCRKKPRITRIGRRRYDAANS